MPLVPPLQARTSDVAVPTESRFDFAKKNAKFGLLSTLMTVTLGFVSRTIFISSLGSAYLGVNALMVNVLGVLSFAELGIGAAMSYSLYKPIAEGDVELVRALTQFYKNVYRVIALIVTLIGLALLPFIPSLASESEGLGDLRVYYVIFLASNVLSYFAVYKTGLATAEQRAYIVTNIKTVATLSLHTLQILALLIWHNYLAFLIVMLAARVAEQLFLHVYLSRRYRAYLSTPRIPLQPHDLAPIKKNVRALIWHKIGDVAVNQTDSIIIAAFINITTLGLIANYNLIINTAALFLSVAMSAAIGSFGNAIATSTPAAVYQNYKTYRFAAFWLYGLATIGMFALLTPLIRLWIGPDMIVPREVVILILVNFYMFGHRVTITTVKSAAGIWAADRYLPLIQALVNLIASIALVLTVGLAGVFIGTVIQGLIATIARPIIVYPRVFQTSPWEYFHDSGRFLGALLLAGACATAVAAPLLHDVTIWRFCVALLAVFAITNIIFYSLFFRRPELDTLRRRLRLKTQT